MFIQFIMKREKFFISILVILVAALAIFFVLAEETALLVHPKGIIAQKQLKVIVDHILLMLIVVIPTMILLFLVVWKYHRNNTNAKYDPELSYGTSGETLLWIIPSIIVAVMGLATWYSTHALDPHRPLKSEVKPIRIQVVGLNWKWLFIYPEQGIASLNFVQFPEKTPINFTLTSDHSPINSFWIAQLSGQIYAMSGMVTPLHMMANEVGEYAGRAAEINGQGLADMVFVAKATTQSDFDEWVAHVKQSPHQLDRQTYELLTSPSINDPVTLYSSVEDRLFRTIIEKYLIPTKE
jgi:cytochrome o ubiquinol oxidase subunit II